MPKKRCMPCGGSGKMMGGGMLLADCDHCDGYGKIDVPHDEIDYLLAKNTEHYNKAKEEIKELATMTDAEAESILDDEIKHQKTQKQIEAVQGLNARKKGKRTSDEQTIY